MSWETVELATVSDINPRMPRGLPDDLDVSFLPMAAVSEAGQIDYQEERKVEQVRKGYTYFRRGDVLVAKITPCFENGKAAKTDALDAEHGFGSTEFHVIRGNPNELLPEYAFHLVWNPYFRKEGTANMTGSAGQKRVPADFLKRLKIPLPPLEEQRRIAGILDAADALRRRRREALALLDTLPGAIFAEMFGDEPDTAGEWPVKKFGDLVADNLIGLVRGAKEISPDLPVPYLKMDSITRAGRIDLNKLVAIEASPEEIEKYSVAPGDLLFNTRNTKELVGKSAVYYGPEGVVINNNVMRIRTTRETSPDFISGYLRSPFGYRQLEQRKSGTTSVFAVYAKSLMTLPVPVPPRELIDDYDDRCRRVGVQTPECRPGEAGIHLRSTAHRL